MGRSSIVVEEGEVRFKPIGIVELPLADIQLARLVVDTLVAELPTVVLVAPRSHLDYINRKAITLKWWN